MGWLPLALLAAIFAGLAAIFGKIGLERVDGTFATVVRAVIMAGFMLLAGWATGRSARPFGSRWTCEPSSSSCFRAPRAWPRGSRSSFP